MSNYCKKCGAELKSNAKFCNKCGTLVTASNPEPIQVNANTCPSCGAALQQGAKFCPVCGNEVSAEAPKAKPEPIQVNANTCPSCGAALKRGAKFCPVCGNEVSSPTPKAKPETMQVNANTCPSCGAALKRGAKFCPKCGMVLASGASASSRQAPPAGTNGSSKDKTKAKKSDKDGMVHGDLTAKFTPEDIRKNKGMAVLAYFGPLVLIPIFAAKKSQYARFHANQALGLAFGWMALWGYARTASALLGIFSKGLGGMISVVLSFAYPVVGIFVILGIIHAASGKAKELPIWGKKRVLKPVKTARYKSCDS